MQYLLRAKFGTDTSVLLQDEKAKFLRGSLESLGIDVSDWDITSVYDVSMRLYLRQLYNDNNLIVREEQDYLKIVNQTSIYEWRLVNKYITKVDSKLCVVFVIETSTPG
jgi:hypothetical protein